MSRSFAANHSWVVHRDLRYISRNLTPEDHDRLALYVVSRDPELYGIHTTVNYQPMLGVVVGKRTIHVRVYNLDAMKKKPDMLASRLGLIDNASYILFDHRHEPYVVHGEQRYVASGESPEFVAEKYLSPATVAALDNALVQQQKIETSRPLAAVS